MTSARWYERIEDGESGDRSFSPKRGQLASRRCRAADCVFLDRTNRGRNSDGGGQFPETTEVAGTEHIPGAFVRGCETSVIGNLGKGWRRDAAAVVVGPLAFFYPGAYADDPKAWFGRHDGGYRSQKVLAVIKQGPS
jgi:hypothetical protein